MGKTLEYPEKKKSLKNFNRMLQVKLNNPRIKKNKLMER